MTGTLDYDIWVKTDKDLGGRAFASRLLESWTTEIDSTLRPEFFDLGEPIRRSLEKEGVGAAVDLWVGSQMPVMLRRRTKPKLKADIEWRTDKGKDPRPYPWGCTAWLNRLAGDTLARKLFRFLIDHFEPAFGWITTDRGLREKHRLTWEDPTGAASQYMGLDVGRFVSVRTDYGREVLPGVYWVTYFGPGAKSIVGEHRFGGLRAHGVEKLDGGHIVRAYAASRDVGTPTAARAEAEIMDQLGREHFFDKAQVNIEALKTDEVTAARVERQIARIKAGPK